ncbi:MAG TPA: aminomethyltransferase family protein, partial [Actinomycetota bacterium]|nr:aminomethyltransferase family protein [Actinomycetota bacterium]
REAAAVIDITPLYKYVISGPDATRLLDRVMTRDVSKLQVNQVSYTPWCDEEGKVIDDGTLTRLTETSYRVTAADPCYRWFVLNATDLDVTIDDVSEGTAGLALQGRLTRPVLEAATDETWEDVRYFRRRLSSIAGVEVDVTRTGYTGDHGYELFMPAEDALRVWDRLFEVGEAYGIRAAGINALDVSRVEAGLILIEVEYTSARHAISEEQTYSPFEIGLGRFVAFGKASDFNGRRALLAEQAAGGPPRRLVGLELEWAGIEGMFAKHGLAPMISPFVQRDPVPVYRESRQIGRATSMVWSPTLKKMIAFGSVEAAFERLGTRLAVEYSVEGERGNVDAHVVNLPFLDLERKRA